MLLCQFFSTGENKLLLLLHYSDSKNLIKKEYNLIDINPEGLQLEESQRPKPLIARLKTVFVAE